MFNLALLVAGDQFLAIWHVIGIVFGIFCLLWSRKAISATWRLYFSSDLFSKDIKRSDLTVCVIGAGFSGIGMAIKLKQLGIKYRIVERSDDLGGTWNTNVYPNCGSDIQSHLYSYSFAPNPRWSQCYAKQPEIKQYLKDVAKHHKLKIEYGKEVVEADWLESEQKWNVQFADGESFLVNVVIQATGPLSQPFIPNFEGSNEFMGKAVHSAYWTLSSEDLKGKRVAVIGTGASGVQIIPEICRMVKHLFVFQRTPCWTVHKIDFCYGKTINFVFEHLPLIRWLYRCSIFLYNELVYIFVMRINSSLRKTLQSLAVKYNYGNVADPVIRNKLIPNYVMGCKQITPSDSYLQTFNRSNVTLVTERIRKLTKKGIVTEGLPDNQYDVDVIIYATGFDIFKAGLGITVRNTGVTNRDVFLPTPTAYLGTVHPAFPNYFTLLHANVTPGHTAILWLTECQYTYITECLKHMIRVCQNKGAGKQQYLSSLSLKRSVLDEYQRFLQNKMKTKVYFTGCKSYYRSSEDVNFVLWPSHLLHFWWLTRKVDLNNYKCTYTDIWP